MNNSHNDENNRDTTAKSTSGGAGGESSPNSEKILWSCVSRNGIIMAEAGQDPFHGAVSQTARGILAKNPTAGWEYYTLSSSSGDGSTGGWLSSAAGGLYNNFKNNSLGSDHHHQQQQQSLPRLKAVKFHIHEHRVEDDDDGEEDEEDESMVDIPTTSTNNYNSSQSSAAIIWVFAAVYNPDATSWGKNYKHVLSDVQSFLMKIVEITELPRNHDVTWRMGSTLACQGTFAPILLQRMQEVTYLGTMARLNSSVERATELMQHNIQAILEREQYLNQLQDQAQELTEMSSVFKKNSTALRRRMMMQNAKHGLILGTAITAAAAVVVVPTLIAIL